MILSPFCYHCLLNFSNNFTSLILKIRLKTAFCVSLEVKIRLLDGREELFDCLIKVQMVPFFLTHLTSHISQVTCLDLGMFAALGHLLSFGAYKRLFAWLLSLWLLHGAWHGDRKDIFFH